jgi:hypothetical protein
VGWYDVYGLALFEELIPVDPLMVYIRGLAQKTLDCINTTFWITVRYICVTGNVVASLVCMHVSELKYVFVTIPDEFPPFYVNGGMQSNA